MKKSILKIIYAAIIFVFALLISDFFINKGNADMTMEMGKAQLPLVYAQRGEQKLNWLHGYKEEMNPIYQNETITAINSQDRQLQLGVELFGNTISSMRYEVRTVDGGRLIEDTEVMDYLATDQDVAVHLTLKDLYELNKQYALSLNLKLADGTSVYYYTRIMMCEEADYVDEYMQFAMFFHESTFDKSLAQRITTYLESSAEGDNTTFSKVDIHSSFSQITWGDLTVKKIWEPTLLVRQLNQNVCRMELSYAVALEEESDADVYHVTEYYYARKGKERMYLLDFERTMSSVFESKNHIYTNNKISLGISEKEIQLKESNDGNNFAFVKENRLYSFNLSNSKLALLFGFYDEDNNDARDTYPNSEIQIINVDETGNTRFLVYGYMNRGNHEGSVGVACYYYNSLLNTIEEEIFIPYDASPAFLEQDIKQLAYVNNNNQLFLLLRGAIYKINLDSKSYTVIVDSLKNDGYRVSSDNKMVVWQLGEDVNRCETCVVLNLSTGKENEIHAGAGQYIKALGFMNTDLVYGVAFATDVYENEFGRTIVPMHCVHIQNEEGTILKNYEKIGIYVISAELNDNLISLNRMTQNGTQFVEIASDQIMMDEDAEVAKNNIEVVPTQEYEKIVQIAAKSNIKTSSLKYLTPKLVMYEGQRELSLPLKENAQDVYYVYDKYGIASLNYHAGEAVELAEELSGYVMNGSGQCIWEKSNRSTVNQIMRITEAKSDENRNTLAVCLDTILNYEGVAGESQAQLDSGKKAFSILTDSLKEQQILELSGCSLNSVLYYVSRDLPVLAILKDGNAVLIVGYNELNTVLLNPATGKIAKMGMNDSKEFFEKNGNCFISYIPKETP